MEKTLTIDGRQVTFKSTAATPLRYKSQFGKDLFADLVKFYPLSKVSKTDLDNMDYQILQQIDFETFYNITWVLAKTADKTIPEPIEWLDSFTEFPIMDILPELMGLIENSLGTTKKKSMMKSFVANR